MNSRLGRFEIQAEVGKGGFGKVFRAFDPLMNRVVAVKVLTATEDAGSFTRFTNEAIAAGNLDHPNIVIIYDSGQEDKTHYIVMEFVDGVDLQHIIRNNTPLSIYQKIRVMDQVADGLYCAHRNGVLHRDIKPANIMLRKDGLVKVMDFGIARLLRDTSITLTQEGYLIGTVHYMAPELLSGTGQAFDAVCDIWSYAVLFYELLSGKNPFYTGNVHSEMIRVLNEDPPRLAPEVCPPDLHIVLNKLLAKSREVRYQSLEDTRFDLQPILKNLEKVEVDRLLSDAQQFMFQERWEEALTVAREARRMDPQNGTARIIFERASKELPRQNVRRRVDDLLNRSRDLAAQKKLTEAVELLNEAKKLDANNDKVLNRLQELRKLKANLEQAAKLLSDADKEFRNEHLTNAFDRISEAVKLDPDNPEVRRMFDTIQAEKQARDQDRAVETEIQRVRGLVAVDNLEGAVNALHAADSKYPQRTEIRELLARLAHLMAEREKRQDFARRLEHAKDLVRNARFEEAVKELEELQESFPLEVEPRDLLSFLTARQRSEDVKRITEAAAEFNRAQRFDEAIRILEDGLNRYRDDLALTRLLRSTRNDLQRFEQERAFQKDFERCQDLRRNRQWQEALDLIARLALDNPGNREVSDLEARIREEKKLEERASAVRTAVSEAQGHLRANQPANAVRVLEAATLAVGADPDLTALLEKARAARQVELDRQYIESEIKHSRAFEQSGDLTTAVRIIDDALDRWPKSRELMEAKDRLRTDAQQARHEREISAGTAAVQAFLDRREYTQARAELEKWKILHPSETVFSRLDEELSLLQREEINQLVTEGRRLLDSGEIADAEQFCLARLRDYRKIPEVIALVQAIQDEKKRRKDADAEQARRTGFVAECLRNAQDLEQQGDPQGALDILQQGLKRYPQESSLIAVRDRLGEALKQRQLFAAIEQALMLSNWEQALQLLDQARTEYPNDPALIPFQNQAFDQRSSFFRGAVAAVRGKINEDKLDVARTLFDQNLARYQDQGIVSAVAGELAAAESQQKSENQRRAFISARLREAALSEQRGDLPGASAILQKALEMYPGEPQLANALNRMNAAIEINKRQRALAETLAAIQKDLDRGKWEAALKKLEEARTAFPDNIAELAALEQQARELREREIRTHVDKASDYLKLGRLEDAGKILLKQLAPFAAEPSVVALANALQEAKLRQTLIQKASTHTAARRFNEAQSTIDELASRSVAEPEVRRLRSDLEAAREQEKRDILYRTGREKGDQLLRDRQYDEAINHFDYLLTQFPADRQLQRDLDGALKARNRTAQRTTIVSQPAPQPRHWLFGIAGGALALVALVAWWIFWPARLDVSPGNLNFVTQAGSPVQGRIIVTGSSDVPLPAIAGGADWITITRAASGAGKTEFLVSASAANLAAGEHSTELIFSSGKNVRVSLVVQATATVAHFDVRPPSLDFAFSKGAIPAQKMVVDSSSDIPDPIRSVPWMTVARNNLGPHKAEFSVSVSAKGLSAGPNMALLTFPDKKVPVTLTVPGPNSDVPLDITPQSLSLSDARGSTRASVFASGPHTILDPKPTENWLRIVARSNPAPGKSEFVVEARPEGLQPGKTYTALLAFPQQKSVRVELTLAPKATPLPPPVLELQPTELSFVYKRVPGLAPLSVTASGPSDIPDPQKTSPWLSVTRDAAEPGKVKFSVQIVSPEKLEPGNYHDELTFSPQKKARVDLVVFDKPQRFCNLQGTSVWSPGSEGRVEELILKGSGGRAAGRVNPPLPACEITIDGSKLPAGVTVVENPSQENNFTLHLRNTSGNPLTSFPIIWTRK